MDVGTVYQGRYVVSNHIIFVSYFYCFSYLWIPIFQQVFFVLIIYYVKPTRNPTEKHIEKPTKNQSKIHWNPTKNQLKSQKRALMHVGLIHLVVKFWFSNWFSWLLVSTFGNLQLNWSSWFFVLIFSLRILQWSSIIILHRYPLFMHIYLLLWEGKISQ